MIDVNKVSLSIIIPAYNEKNYLKACLDSIAVQTDMPDKVFVIDNNSTDETAAIAASYPFVTVLHEKRQGQIFAQADGFNAADTDLLGRIDADTVLPKNWCAMVKHIYSEHPDILAVSGRGVPYDFVLVRTAITFFEFYHQKVSSFFSGHPMIWGSNCVITAPAWQAIKDDMSYDPKLWEDYEMGLLIARHGTVRFDRRLRVGASFRTGHYGFVGQFAYQFRSVRTMRRYLGMVRATLFFFAWYSMIILFPLTVLDRILLKIKGKPTPVKL